MRLEPELVFQVGLGCQPAAFWWYLSTPATRLVILSYPLPLMRSNPPELAIWFVMYGV